MAAHAALRDTSGKSGLALPPGRCTEGGDFIRYILPEMPEKGVQDRLAALDMETDLFLIPDRGAPRLFVADMDSTIIEEECIDELADLAGKGEDIARITRQAMEGGRDFSDSLTERVAALAGTDAGLIEQALAERIHIREGARDLTAAFRKAGARTVMVSGGFHTFANRIGKAAGFDFIHANELIIHAGRLTGRVRTPILGAEEKRNLLIDHARRMNLSPGETAVAGDGANDLMMMREAGTSFSVFGKPAVEKKADGIIRYSGLRAIGHALGLEMPAA